MAAIWGRIYYDYNFEIPSTKSTFYKDKVTQIFHLLIIVRKHLRENFLAYVYNDSCLFTFSSFQMGLKFPTPYFPYVIQVT